jgi:hypothetical protein
VIGGESRAQQPGPRDFNHHHFLTPEEVVDFLTSYVSNLCGCGSEMTLAELLHHLSCSPRHCSCAARARAEQARLKQEEDGDE